MKNYLTIALTLFLLAGVNVAIAGPNKGPVKKGVVLSVDATTSEAIVELEDGEIVHGKSQRPLIQIKEGDYVIVIYFTKDPPGDPVLIPIPVKG